MKTKSAASFAFFFATSCLLVVWLLALWGCNSRRPEQRRYPFEGEVISIDKAAGQVTVNHQDIPGLMKGMTMPFQVKDAAVLDSLKPGQHIQATLVIEGDYKSWLEDIQVTGPGDVPHASAFPSNFHAPTKGEAVPDFALTNQNGRKVHLAQYRGEVVLVTFVYTRCPLPDFCPRMTHNFQQLEQAVEHDPSLDKRTHLLTISIDPQFDTPKVMRAYALRSTNLPAGDLFAHWDFLTPSVHDLDKITAFFGLSQMKEEGQLIHSLSTTVIDPEGHVFAWYHGNAWTTNEVLQKVRDCHAAGSSAQS